MIDVLARYVAMPVIGVVLVVVAAVSVGALIAWLVLPSRKKVRQLEADLAELNETHSRYKGDVLEHFQTTSELFGQLTESYRAVYRHLAHGAETLCSDHTALEGSVFAASRLLEEPVLDVGARTAAAGGSESSRVPDARLAAEAGVSGVAGSREARDAGETPGATSAPDATTGEPAAGERATSAAADDRMRQSETVAEPQPDHGGPWRMDAPTRVAASSDLDDDAAEDEVARASFDRDESPLDEGSNRDVLAARSH